MKKMVLLRNKSLLKAFTCAVIYCQTKLFLKFSKEAWGIFSFLYSKCRIVERQAPLPITLIFAQLLVSKPLTNKQIATGLKNNLIEYLPR
jgi:hypothetical protein